MKSPQTIAKFKESLRKRNDENWRMATLRIARGVAKLKGLSPEAVIHRLDPVIFDRQATKPAMRRKAINAAAREAKAMQGMPWES